MPCAGDLPEGLIRILQGMALQFHVKISPPKAVQLCPAPWANTFHQQASRQRSHPGSIPRSQLTLGAFFPHLRQQGFLGVDGGTGSQGQGDGVGGTGVQLNPSRGSLQDDSSVEHPMAEILNDHPLHLRLKGPNGLAEEVMGKGTLGEAACPGDGLGFEKADDHGKPPSILAFQHQQGEVRLGILLQGLHMEAHPRLGTVTGQAKGEQEERKKAFQELILTT